MSLILPGGEPFYLPGGPIGCLLIHGITATPQEMRRMGAHLAGQGYSVLAPRIAGHATSVEDMARTRWPDWLASVEDGYHLLRGTCEQIVIAGLSLGGALALLLAWEFPVSGVVVMAAPYDLPPIPALRILRPILRPVSGIVHAIPKGPPDMIDKEALAERVDYRAYPLRAIVELDALLKGMRTALPQIHAPALLMHSNADTFVPPSHMQMICDHLGSADKQTFTLERSTHVITCDLERQAVFDQATSFIRRVTEG